MRPPKIVTALPFTPLWTLVRMKGLVVLFLPFLFLRLELVQGPERCRFMSEHISETARVLTIFPPSSFFFLLLLHSGWLTVEWPGGGGAGSEVYFRLPRLVSNSQPEGSNQLARSIPINHIDSFFGCQKSKRHRSNRFRSVAVALREHPQ